MPRNLEIKARVPSLVAARVSCSRIRARRKGVLSQTDTYFHVPRGRLKLREINGKQFELIYYFRDDRTGTRYSDYIVVPLREARKMKGVCKLLFGVQAVVRKNRRLFLYKNSRIHLDIVKGLGSFIEFEVLVLRGKKQAEQLMEFLIREFRISDRPTVAGSYADMV